MPRQAAPEGLSARASAAFGATAILLALVLVPVIWECGAGVAGWNVLVFGLVAVGSSSFGSAAGRSTGRREIGIFVTVVAVLASLLLLKVVTEGTC